MTAVGLSALAIGLMKNSSLRSLSLRDNDLGDSDPQTWESILGEGSRLEVLDIENIGLEPDGLLCLAENLPALGADSRIEEL